MIDIERYKVWSAAPTPFDQDMRPDHASVEKMIEHHANMNIGGLFIGGSCGEGTYMSCKDLYSVVKTAAKASAGRMLISAQCTDVSAARTLENLEDAAKAGADIGVIATPFGNGNTSAKQIREIIMGAIESSPLPIGVYDRGKMGAFEVPEEVLVEAYMHPNVVMVKDSSNDMQHAQLALKVRKDRPELRLMNGFEFDTVRYLQAGYDGMLLGGAVFNAPVAYKIYEAFLGGDLEEANRQQQRMNQLMYAVYGEGVKFWMIGLKYLMVEMGLFSTTKMYLDYELSDECIAGVKQALVDYADVLRA